MFFTTFATQAKVSNFVDAQLMVQQVRERLQQRHNQIPEDQKAKQVQSAQKVSENGAQALQKKNYALARKHFKKAIVLDPFVDNYYYYYAISLYRLKRYHSALVVFKQLEESFPSIVNLYFYQALVYYELNRLGLAVKKFEYTEDEGDPDFSPTASMYLGLISYKAKDYPVAKKKFQKVLDTSKDPAMDRQAEAYIEEITRIEALAEEKKKKWAYTFNAGLMYDENVLNLAANNLATDLEAYRLLAGASLTRRLVYTPKSSWAARLSVSDIFSIDKDFESTATIQQADPLQLTYAMPYTRQLRLAGKNGLLSLTPGYQLLFMQDGSGSEDRDIVFASGLLTASLDIAQTKSWFSKYQIDISHDDSRIDVTNQEDDQTALKYSLLYTGTVLLGGASESSVFFDLLYAMNDADGDNNIYNQLLFAVGGSRQLSSKWLGYLRAEYFAMEFDKSSTDRSDESLTLALGAQWLWSKRSTMSMDLQYTDNQSNVETFDYDKIAFTVSWSFDSGFF